MSKLSNSKRRGSWVENTAFLRRSGDLAAWSLAATGSIVLMRLILGLVADPSRTNNYSPLWLLISVTTIAAQVAVVWVLMLTFMIRLLKRRLAPFLNISVVGMVGGLANVSIGIWASSLGLDNWDKWEFRFVGGFVGNAMMFVLVNNLAGAYRERAKRVAELRQSENELQGVRESSAQMLADEQEVLQRMTQSLLLPPIEKISMAIEKENVIAELRTVISNDVRPLSNEIMSRVAKLQESGSFDEKLPRLKPKWLTTFDVRKSIRPWSAFSLLVLAYPLTMYLIVDHRSFTRGVISAFFAAAVMQIIKWLLPKDKQVQTGIGIIYQSLISALAAVPGVLVFYSEHGPIAALIPAAVVLVLLSVSVTFFLAYSRGLDNTRKEFEIQLREFQEQLALEVALFEQKLWLDRRAWSFLIHGTVQSSLTAALVRLQAGENDEATLALVREDLDRAKSALLASPVRFVNIETALQDLERTWGGICEFKTTISSSALQLLNNSNDASVSVNEIAKEAVSNAIRHANANVISITIDKSGNQIELTVSNNGVEYKKDAKPGLGSRMITDLTLTWSLESDAGNTVLRAVVPVATNG